MKLFDGIEMVITELIKKRIEIRQIYKNGIGKAFFLLRCILPLAFLIIFLFLIDYLDLKDTDIEDFIKQINSLVGIILGFSIASFAIFISINNQKLEEVSQQTKYTYREIGSSLFFYNVEVALFTSLIGIILLYINLPALHITDLLTLFTSSNFSIWVLFNIKIFLFLIYIMMFFQLIFNLFYSSLFLNSSIKKHTV
jgi:hypothetical protein